MAAKTANNYCYASEDDTHDFVEQFTPGDKFKYNVYFLLICQYLFISKKNL